MNAGYAPTAARLFACAGVSVLLAGCANPFASAKIDPQSPVVAEANAAAHPAGPFPRFTEIPPVPKDVRPKATYGAQATAILTTRDQLVAATDPNTWTLSNTAIFANTALSAAGPEQAPADPAATEAFARDLRKRATPPPPPKR
jgi:hypothetical protein